MEELGVTADTEFYDPGYYETGGVRFQNWYPVPQQEISFVDAIAWSNNTVFFELGHRLYKEDKTLLQKYAREFGLGQKTEVDLNNEAQGLVPDPQWRKEKFNNREDQIWYPGYTINLSIGQGNLRTSPIQLLNLVCGVANGGKLYQPLLVDKIVSPEGEVVKDLEPKLLNEIPVEKETFSVITEGLKGVTSYGTAEDAFKGFPLAVAGKTGTAQTGRDRANHGWFTGFAPADDPEIAVVVFIEYGSSSSYTLSIAQGVLAEYFDLEFTPEAEEIEETEIDTSAPPTSEVNSD
jgi:penicillin-binding protein 2